MAVVLRQFVWLVGCVGVIGLSQGMDSQWLLWLCGPAGSYCAGRKVRLCGSCGSCGSVAAVAPVAPVAPARARTGAPCTRSHYRIKFWAPACGGAYQHLQSAPWYTPPHVGAQSATLQLERVQKGAVLGSSDNMQPGHPMSSQYLPVD